MAENKNWKLFFDEADASFGKNTLTANDNDRYTDQEIAYLLQRIEDFPGLIILATNFKTNINDALDWRFQFMERFPEPSVQKRLVLWQKAFRDVRLENDCDFKKIASKYVLTVKAAINLPMYCLLYKNHKEIRSPVMR